MIQDCIDTYRVGLILTEKCNLSCRHCWFSCGPHARATMALDDALSYIRQAREIPTVEWISISGGEPFLFLETLKELISFATGLGLHTECVTNCFWAKTKHAAFSVLRKLKDAGLEVINISADDFHQEQLPFDRVRTCYWSSLDIGLKPVIMCTVARSSTLTAREVARLMGDEGIHTIGNWTSIKKPPSALAVESGFIPVGRGARIPKEEWMVGSGPLRGPCSLVLRDISIAPSGKVNPCCSVAGLAETLDMGNARRNSLKGIIREASTREVFKVLAAEGPIGLQRHAGLALGRGYVSKCHLCYEMLIHACVNNLRGKRGV